MKRIKELWNVKTQFAPVVIRALCSMPKDLEHWLEVLGIKPKINDLQKTVILDAARIP